MKKLAYDNWQMPSEDNLQQEYKVEYQLKPRLRRELGGDIWTTYGAFKNAAANAKVVTVNSQSDRQVMFEMKSIYPELLLKEQNMSDIVIPTQETEITPEDEFDPTTPMVKEPVPFSKNNDNLFVDPMIEESLLTKVIQPFNGERYAELGAIVGMLEGLSVLFQTLHWQINGQSFYGDHLMFQRIYETFDDQIDAVAEKAVGLGNEKLVDSGKITKTLDIFLNHIRSNAPTAVMDDNKQSFSIKGKYALEVFIQTVEKIMLELKDKGELSKGLDNLLAGILDIQESNLYLLKQRVLASL